MNAMRGVDPRFLQSFLAVCELGSFSHAARLRGVSQPTVSQHVQRLESMTGAPLLLRGGGRIVPTDAGESLRVLAQALVSAQRDVERLLSGLRAGGRVRFGAAEDFASTRLAPILRDFTAAHPGVRLSLKVAGYEALTTALKVEELDLILVKQFDGHLFAPFRGRTIAEEQLVWVASSDFVLDADESVPLVMYRAPSATRERVVRALVASRRSWVTGCECQGFSGMLAALEAGLGVGVLPESLVPSELTLVGDRFSLPAPGRVRFALLTGRAIADEDGAAVEALADAVSRSVS